MATRDTLADNSEHDLDLRYQHWRKSVEETHPGIVDHPHRRPRRIPVVPDLRFEQSYLQSIKPYVHIVQHNSVDIPIDAKGKMKAVAVDETERNLAHREDIQIQWGRVVWITTRDQVISPLLQGALRGLAGVFLVPLLNGLGERFQIWWAKGATPAGRPRSEGHGVGWLRDWVSSLTAGSSGGTYNLTNAR